ncbi:MAG: NADH-quinone oxidoreductase subunit NuoF [Deltaproteobacteria bacterium]|nr:NADH-quinone oxidoreductase subunit NuoF [Deltaproteobacteria bacterium]
MSIKLVTRNFDRPDSHTLRVYREGGGYETLRKVLATRTPQEVVEEVKRSNLRGRGGAGFPTGMKWSFVPRETGKPVYLCVNADEGEPGTFKDRFILEQDPHMLLEGIGIAAYAIGARYAYLYLRGEFVEAGRRVEDAIAEACEAGLLGSDLPDSKFSLDLYVHYGAGAYICGEETALLESIEGKKGWPRVRPPFPAVKGLFGSPTVINNVETLAKVPHILEKGAAWFSALGTEKSGGTKLFPVSGKVNRPGLYEYPLGTPLRTIIDEGAGGVSAGKKIKGVIPGGASCPVLTADEIDVPMDYDALAKVGSMLGSGAIIVLDEETSMLKTLLNLERFFAHESCGQCTPCREGTRWIVQVLERIAAGKGAPEDPDLLLDIAAHMAGRTLCPLGDAAAGPVRSFVTKFREEFLDPLNSM